MPDSSKIKREEFDRSIRAAIDAAQNDSENAPTLLEEAVRLAREQGDRKLLRWLLSVAAGVLLTSDEAARAGELANECLQLCLEESDYETLEEAMRVLIAAALTQGGRAPIWAAFDRVARWAKRNQDWLFYLDNLEHRVALAQSIGDLEVRDAAFDECLEFARAQRDSVLISETLIRIAAARLLDGKIDEAERRAREGLAAARGANSRVNIGKARAVLSQVAMQRDDFATAWFEAERVVAIGRELDDPEALARRLELAAIPSLSLGERDRGWRLLDEALDLSRKGNDSEGITRNLTMQVRLAADEGEADRARERLDDLIQFARSGKTADIRAILLEAAGNLAQQFVPTVAAPDLFNEAVTAAREAGEPELLTRALLAFGDACMDNQPTEAEAHVREAYEIASETEDDSIRADALDLLAGIARAKGDTEHAIEHLEERLDILRDLPGPDQDIDILSTQAALMSIAVHDGDLLSTQGYTLEHLERAISANLPTIIRRDLQLLAILAVSFEEPEKAARLFGAAAAINLPFSGPEELRDHEETEKNMSDTSAALGAERFNALFAEGQSMTPEQALRVAIGDFSETPDDAD